LTYLNHSPRLKIINYGPPRPLKNPLIPDKILYIKYPLATTLLLQKHGAFIQHIAPSPGKQPVISTPGGSSAASAISAVNPWLDKNSLDI
jgi:hypothetical protein